jgi:predicted amidohydrolase YtcJ
VIKVDLRGAAMMPGPVDAHSHLFNGAEQYFDMSLTEVQRISDQSRNLAKWDGLVLGYATDA